MEASHAHEGSTVGIRELRQNLSVYLELVKAGRELTVTDHGRPVARLAPLVPQGKGLIQQLIDEGRAIPPRRPGGVDSLPPPLQIPPGMPTGTETLLQMRDEEQW